MRAVAPSSTRKEVEEANLIAAFKRLIGFRTMQVERILGRLSQIQGVELGMFWLGSCCRGFGLGACFGGYSGLRGLGFLDLEFGLGA